MTSKKFICFFFLVLCSPIYANSSTGIDSIMTTSSIWRMFLSLAVIIAIIPAAIFLMKKLQNVQHKLGKSPIQVVNVQALGAKEKLVIVDVEGKRLLLGVTGQSISLIKTLSDEDFSQYLKNDLADTDVFDDELNESK